MRALNRCAKIVPMFRWLNFFTLLVFVGVLPAHAADTGWKLIGKTVPETGESWSDAMAASRDHRLIIVGLNPPQIDNKDAEVPVAAVYNTGARGLTRAGILSAKGVRSGELTGHAIAVAADGKTIAVGGTAATGKSGITGAVYVFQQLGDGAWKNTGRLSIATADAAPYFGAAVAVSPDGSRLAVSAAATLDKPVPSDLTARVVVFEHRENSWQETARLSPPSGISTPYFGTDLQFLDSADSLVVGAPGGTLQGKDAGRFIQYTKAGGTWQPSQTHDVTGFATGKRALGSRMATTTDYTVLAAVSPLEENPAPNDYGAAYLFARDASGAYIQTTRLTASQPDALRTRQGIGSDVCLANAGGRVFVSAAGKGVEGSTNQGAVYVFDKNAETSTWGLTAFLRLPSKRDGEQFGWRIACDPAGRHVAVLTPGYKNADGMTTGAVFYLGQ